MSGLIPLHLLDGGVQLVNAEGQHGGLILDSRDGGDILRHIHAQAAITFLGDGKIQIKGVQPFAT